MDRRVVFGIIWMLSAFSSCYGHRVLLLPIQTKIHVNEHVVVARALKARGNDVYMAVPDFFPWKKLTDSANIELITYKQQDNETLYTDQYEAIISKHINNVKNFRSISHKFEEYKSVLVTKMCRWMMDDVNFTHEVKFMNFEVALVDIIPSAPCNAIVPYNHGIKFVSLSSVDLPGVGLPPIPSFVPAITSEYSDEMSFWQRLSNFMQHRQTSRTPSYSGVLDTSLLEKYPRKGKVVAWSDVVEEASLFLTPRDHILEWSAPKLPNHVPLPGLTQQLVKRLPNHLDNYMLKAIDGVILISFGSIYDRLDRQLVDKLFQVFRELKDFSFLLKMNAETQRDLMHATGGIPKNVWIVNWVPQNDILAHKKTVLFITHCGNNGQYEALYHGKPMIGLPVYPEQNHNCVRMHSKGYGICMDTWSFSVDMLVTNIKLLLKSKYREKLEHVSAIMKDRPLPSQIAAFWLEHVSQYGGDHMRSSGPSLSYYKYWMLDILLFFVFLFALTFIGVYVVLVYGVDFAKNKLRDEQILNRKLM